MTSERSITKQIQTYLKVIGAKVIKTHGSQFFQAGTPDLIGAWDGKPLALEVKRPGEKPTKLQEKEMEAWRRAGAITAVVHSVDDVRNLLWTSNHKGEQNGTKK